MSQSIHDLKIKLIEIDQESAEFDLKMFTSDLLECVLVDLVEGDDENISIELIEAYMDEIENSIEIYNPKLKNDVKVLENLLNALDFYLEGK